MEIVAWTLLLIIATIYRYHQIILYVIFIILVGKVVFNKSRLKARYAFILVMLLVPIALVVNSYMTFQEACKSAKTEDFSNSPIQNVEGYFRRNAISPAENYIGMVSEDLLSKGIYEYIEHGNTTAGYAIYRMNGGRITNSKIISRQSEYDFEITNPESVSPFLTPYLMTSRVRIVRASDGIIISQATEFLLVGWGLKENYQGCGYVDVGIHQFRPLVAGQLNDKYKERDREFILKTLVPKRTIYRNTSS